MVGLENQVVIDDPQVSFFTNSFKFEDTMFVYSQSPIMDM